MIQTVMLQLLVTVWLGGAPVAQERLPEVFRATDDKCVAAAEFIRKRAAENMDVTVECVPAQRSA